MLVPHHTAVTNSLSPALCFLLQSTKWMHILLSFSLANSWSQCAKPPWAKIWSDSVSELPVVVFGTSTGLWKPSILPITPLESHKITGTSLRSKSFSGASRCNCDTCYVLKLCGMTAKHQRCKLTQRLNSYSYIGFKSTGQRYYSNLQLMITIPLKMSTVSGSN